MLAENKVNIMSRKNDSIINFSNYLEIKWISSVCKCNSSSVYRETKIGQRIYWEWSVLRYFISSVIFVSDFNIKIIEGMAMECKYQLFCDRACWFEIVSLISSIGKTQSDG
jgi:hypothetical protein